MMSFASGRKRCERAELIDMRDLVLLGVGRFHLADLVLGLGPHSSRVISGSPW